MKIETFKALAAAFLGVLVAAPATSFGEAPFAQRAQHFERQVDEFRRQLKIPGLSAVILKDQKVVWLKGFGFADLENRIAATPDTLYSIASVTKTFAATLVMQLVEQGKLDLDEPISHYSADFKDDSVRIRHLITHTSHGTPGERFEYDGNRYDYLTAVIEKKTGKRFLEVVVETFFDPLGMSASVPYHDVAVDADKWVASIGRERLDRYRRNLAKLAQPYGYYGAGEIVHSTYPPRDFIGAAAGLLSTVRDLAKYDVAIDRHVFVRKETQQRAWTPSVSNSGERLPYGLGWFVTGYHGLRLIWHSGQWGTGFSAMYLKVPERNVSIILLANSEALAGHGGDQVTNNAFVCSFLALWNAAYDCDRPARAEMAKWIEQRRAGARVAIRLESRILDSYAGRYQFEALENRIYTVTREGDRLFVAAPQRPKLELFPESETTFFMKVRPYLLIFSKADGQPPQLEIVDGADKYRSKRLE